MWINPVFLCCAAAKQINEWNIPPTDETSRMKRVRLSQDPRKEFTPPAFLNRPPSTTDGAGASSQPQEEANYRAPKTMAYKPGWGFRRCDSILGSTTHCADWSKHSLTQADYQDVVLGSPFERVEGMGAQAMASVSRPNLLVQFISF